MAMMLQASSAEMIMLTRNDRGKEITVPRGTVIQIELAAAGGSGYLWQFEDLDREHFELIRTETEIGGKPGFTGAPNITRWQVKTKEQGQAELKLYCFRPWEGKDKAVDKFVVRVRII
jgi:predicted secreted protein